MTDTVQGGVNVDVLLLAPEDCVDDDPRIGGKGRNLLRLVRSGLPVPAFHCISAEAHAWLVEHFRTDIERALASLDYRDGEAVESASREIRGLLCDAPLPAALDVLLRDLPDRLPDPERPRSVRSSAQAEDGARDSYAGQLESYLSVPRDELGTRVRQCWASAFGTRLLHYLHVRGRDPLGTRVAVVVQQMLESAVSGVLFTLDPAGQRDAVVISAGLGLGEGIVADRVETDSFWIDRRDGKLEHTLRRKSSRIGPDPSGRGTTLFEVDTERAERAALDDAELRALAELGLHIEKLCGAPQDIEWALDEARHAYILQTRPITTLGRGQVAIFDNSNIVEGYPGVTLPLTFSFVRGLYEAIFRGALRRMGVAERKLTQNAHVFRDMIGYVEGRLYYVLTSWYPILRLLPGADRLVPAWEESVGIREHRSDEGSRPGRLLSLGSSLYIGSRVGLEWWGLGRSMRRLAARFEATASEIRGRDLEQLEAYELASLIDDSVARMLDGWEITILNDFLAIFFSNHSRRLLDRVEGSTEGLWNDLLCGETGIASVDPVRSLMRLGEMARQSPRVMKLLEEIEASERPVAVLMNGWPEDPDLVRFRAAFREHIDRYGDRCFEELKLECRSYRIEPRGLIPIVLRHAGSQVSIEEMEAREQAIRGAAEARLARALRSRPLVRLLLAFTLRQARRSIGFRERARLDRARAFAVARSVFRAIGRSLVRDGALEHLDDVFLLTQSELFGYIRGGSVDPDLKRIAAERRARYASYRERRPADRITARGSVYATPIPQRADGLHADAAQTVLRGVACAPGSVTAEALVVHDPASAENGAGRVVVAPMTDPGWVFLMTTAAALVVEKGSILSHTAIIGRELGVPTVVNVAHATELIRTGARVHVDGSSGTVTILSSPETCS